MPFAALGILLNPTCRFEWLAPLGELVRSAVDAVEKYGRPIAMDAALGYKPRTVFPDKLLQQLEYSLEALPTPFACLVFLASLRDPYTGRYMQEGWAIIATAGEIHQALEEAHREIFSQVVALPLAEFCRELKEHLASLDQPEGGVAKLWLEIEPFRDMVPQGCSVIERSLFVSQVRLALEILLRLPGLTAGVERAASPPRLPDLPLRPRYLN